LGEERMIVSPVAGTTRDSVDSILDVGDTRFVLIDTAGLRRSARVHEDLEFYTALRSVRAIQRADVVCVMLDATTPLGAQDFKIAETAAESGKAIFFAINKWDLIEKDEKTAGIFVRDLQARGYAFSWAPILFLSALSGQRAIKTLDMARTVLDESRKRIPTSELNETILKDIRDKPPPAMQGKFIKINYVTQAEAQPPTFIIFCNHPELIAEPYSRFVIKRIRERYSFSGAPVRVWWRRKGKREGK
jgi:GTP-binding protein